MAGRPRCPSPLAPHEEYLMHLVVFALRRPISLVVLVIAVALAGLRMPKDIFPDLGVPVLYVAQPYGGMDPAKMEG